jgi:nucleotide-binding universal stress UspA family protein
MFKIQTILHPTEFSAPARHAFMLASSLAHSQSARLVVLHVTTPLSVVAQRQVAGQRVVGRPFEKLWQQLEEIQPPFSGVPVEHRLEVGEAAAEIVRVVQEGKCDLIVMGTQGRTGLPRLLMGSVAEQVVRSAPCPVVTVRLPMTSPSSSLDAPPTDVEIRTVLHPTDFSVSSDVAFQLACSLSRDHDAQLVVLHVAPVLVPPPSEMGTPPQPTSHENLWQALKQVHAPDPNVRVQHLLEDGFDAATVIRDTAGAVQCDLIVMGTHGRTGLDRLLMGSVAEKVLRSAPCPVLTVKVPLPKEPSSEMPEEQQSGETT